MVEPNVTIMIATAALAGWWLTLRPNATYRGAGPTTSVLIIVMAVLMSFLAMGGQSRLSTTPPAYAMVSPHSELNK